MVFLKKLGKAFLMCLSMFSIIPCPQVWDEVAFGLVIPLLPVVGAIIGALWYGFYILLAWLHTPLVLCTGLLLLFPLFISGFIHIDGMMDTSDAIFSRASLEKRRAILKDPNVGAFAVIALCVYLLLGFSSVYTVLENSVNTMPLLTIPILARCVSGTALLNCDPISETGFAASFKQNTKPAHIAVLMVIAACCLLLGFISGDNVSLVILFGLIAAGICLAWHCTRQLGGISGDLCGFIITGSELFALILWAVL